jgi:hypothetical protein
MGLLPSEIIGANASERLDRKMVLIKAIPGAMGILLYT